MRFYLGLAFILIPAAELAVLFAIEDQIGWPWSIAVIIFTGVVGSILVRSQGSSVFARIKDAFTLGSFPVAS